MFDFSRENGLFSGVKGAENAIGHYAVSLAGHDSGKIYLVVGQRGGAGKAGTAGKAGGYFLSEHSWRSWKSLVALLVF